MAAASSHGMRILKLPEYEGVAYARSELDEATMVLLHAMKPAYVDVQPPCVTGSGWRLTALGSVGYLPVTENLALALLPKSPIHNLLRMLEVAYQFDVKWGKSLFEAGTIPDLYERLAMILAHRTIDRCRQGIYRTYAGNAEELAYVLDTKYKVRPSPNSDDVAQVVAYAVAFGAPEAVLVYPSSFAADRAVCSGDIVVRTLAFHLGGDLEEAGKQFVQALLDA